MLTPWPAFLSILKPLCAKMETPINNNARLRSNNAAVRICMNAFVHYIAAIILYKFVLCTTMPACV